MLKSMTAYGRNRETVNGKDITAEIRSVNSRFLDCSAKLPRAYSFLEEKIKPFISSLGISRGKVEVFISVESAESTGATVTLDSAYAAAYVSALRELRDSFSLTDDITVSSVAQNRDIFTITKPKDDIERDWQDISYVLSKAAELYLDASKREGAALAADLADKLAHISALVGEIEKLAEVNVAAYKARLEEKLRQTLADNAIKADESRILTECAIFADRVAVDEETVRLRTHLKGFTEILDWNEPAGKRLDFLTQEINREINTIGSKCMNADMTKIVVDMKCEAEKIREQIQNIV